MTYSSVAQKALDATYQVGKATVRIHGSADVEAVRNAAEKFLTQRERKKYGKENQA